MHKHRFVPVRQELGSALVYHCECGTFHQPRLGTWLPSISIRSLGDYAMPAAYGHQVKQ